MLDKDKLAKMQQIIGQIKWLVDKKKLIMPTSDLSNERELSCFDMGIAGNCGSTCPIQLEGRCESPDPRLVVEYVSPEWGYHLSYKCAKCTTGFMNIFRGDGVTFHHRCDSCDIEEILDYVYPIFAGGKTNG